MLIFLKLETNLDSELKEKLSRARDLKVDSVVCDLPSEQLRRSKTFICRVSSVTISRVCWGSSLISKRKV